MAECKADQKKETYFHAKIKRKADQKKQKYFHAKIKRKADLDSIAHIELLVKC
jgi:hypothetical protein